MSNKTKKHQMKHQILKSIQTGNQTARDIKGNIDYPHRIDSLYQELYYLYRHGFVNRNKHSRYFSYTLTERGLEHAINPYVDAEKRLKRTRSINQNEMLNAKIEKMESVVSKDVTFKLSLTKLYSPNDLISADTGLYAVLNSVCGYEEDIEKLISPEYLRSWLSTNHYDRGMNQRGNECLHSGEKFYLYWILKVNYKQK